MAKATKEKIDTNNDWGFGGRTGTKFVLGDITHFIGKGHTRHTGTYKVVHLQIGDKYFNNQKDFETELAKIN